MWFFVDADGVSAKRAHVTDVHIALSKIVIVIIVKHSVVYTQLICVHIDSRKGSFEFINAETLVHTITIHYQE